MPLLRHDQTYLEQGFRSLAGVDEAGRGPLAGPVVAAAVIVRDFSFSSVIRDSKQLSAKQRSAAYGEILEKCVVSTALVDAHRIDATDILAASLLAMRQAVVKLAQEPDGVLVDGPHALEMPLRQFPIIDGDSRSLAIACASIVAKVTRDRMMEYYDEIYPQYGFKKHKGYGTAEHVEALKKHGPCRIHFGR